MAEASPLSSFVANELQKCGLAASPNAGSDDFVWTVTRDQYGFTLKTEADAHAVLRSLLERAMGVPKFDSSGTLIFRDDQHQTTVMLNRDSAHTECILLHWSDSEIRVEVEESVAKALTQVVDDELRAIEDLLVESELASDDTVRSEKTIAAWRRIQDLRDAIPYDRAEP